MRGDPIQSQKKTRLAAALQDYTTGRLGYLTKRDKAMERMIMAEIMIRMICTVRCCRVILCRLDFFAFLPFAIRLH